MNQASPDVGRGLRHRSGGCGIDQFGLGALFLALVNIGHGGRIDHDIGRGLPDHVCRLVRIPEIGRLAPPCDDLVICRVIAGQSGTEAAARTKDDNSRHGFPSPCGYFATGLRPPIIKAVISSSSRSNCLLSERVRRNQSMLSCISLMPSTVAKAQKNRA